MDVKYSKEVAKLSGKIAVYLHGESIEVGDIINFPNGDSFLGKPRPLGNFRKITSLKNLGVNYKEPDFSKSPDSYLFSSSSSNVTKINIGADIDLRNDQLPSGKGKFGLQFSSEGSLYFSTTDCDSKELDDLVSLEKEINDKGKESTWNDNFLVVSLTVAKKAFIAQSREKTSEIQFEGNAKALQLNKVNIAAETNLHIKNQKGSVFVKDWSENVTVFMDVVRFEKKIFGTEEVKRNVASKSVFSLKKVDYKELLED